MARFYDLELKFDFLTEKQQNDIMSTATASERLRGLEFGYNDLSSKQIENFFNSLVITDVELLAKFHTKYRKMVGFLIYAYEGFALLSDLHELYCKHSNTKMTYQHFSDVVREMERDGLVKSSKYNNKKVVLAKKKLFKLFYVNQADVRDDRISNESIRKARILTQIHLKLLDTHDFYKPSMLVQDAKFKNVYTLETVNENDECVIQFYVPLTRDNNSAQTVQSIAKRIQSVVDNSRFGATKEVIFCSLESEGEKRAIANKVKSMKSLSPRYSFVLL